MTDVAIIPTICAIDGTCPRLPFELADDWVKLFILKSSSAVIGNFTKQEFSRISHASVQLYDSIIGTNNPDLSGFRSRGGKSISYHGMVMAMDANVQEYYRLFLAPGVHHCFGGPGPFPDTTFDALRLWVEDGVALETLTATSTGTTPVIQRLLCPYPQKQHYKVDAVDATKKEGYYCK
ncbi:Carboxylic ester hydrolase [Tolypocladium paradoxum]|uniref:Carboxylic ester hydrolase n=1 Tax=Tolypocladium paradoxum TaxID=94208 RepID=A0A2S4KXL5_9HYPO|nr:Carboxylic ester hydrolase [Tolypocladium paradoxum]